jgi:hypothetical protein
MSANSVSPDATVTASELATWLDVSRQRVGQLADDGVLERDGDRRFPLKASVRAFAGWQRRAVREPRRKDEATRINEARARSLEMKNARLDRSLIDIDEHDAILDEAFGMLKAELIGLPARITRDHALRRKIEAEVDGALNRLADRCLTLSQAADYDG